jgi:hypothetical protein
VRIAPGGDLGVSSRGERRVNFRVHRFSVGIEQTFGTILYTLARSRAVLGGCERGVLENAA